MPLDRARLSKLLALAESNQPGEAANAMAAATRLLAAEGMTLRDLAGPQPAPTSSHWPGQLGQGIRAYMDGLAHDLSRARTENDRLRDELQSWQQKEMAERARNNKLNREIKGLYDRLDKSAKENARLRNQRNRGESGTR